MERAFPFPPISTFIWRGSKSEFPAEAGAIDKFFDLVREVYYSGLLAYFRWREMDRLDPYRHWTVHQALEHFFRDKKLKLLLTADCGHWGSSPERTSFIFDSMLRLSYFLGNYYPRGGSQAFADELAQRFEERGGHILMSSSVKQINIQNRTAHGIEIETGRAKARFRLQIKAGVVVSNADLLLTLEKMVGAAQIEPERLAAIRTLRPTHPCFLTHIGVRGIATDVLRAAHGYHWSSWDYNRVATDAFKIFVPTLYEPALAPADGHIVIVQKLTAIDYEKIEDWTSHKTQVENYILSNLERVIPGFSEKIVVKTSATAFTSQRFTLNHHGAMLGWEMSPDQIGQNRPALNGLIKNLYFTGHWTQPGGGITPVIVSAMEVAKKITKGGTAGFPVFNSTEAVAVNQPYLSL